MVRKFSVGESVVYCGEGSPVRVRVAAPFGAVEAGGVVEPLYRVESEGGWFVCSESWLSREGVAV